MSVAKIHENKFNCKFVKMLSNFEAMFFFLNKSRVVRIDKTTTNKLVDTFKFSMELQHLFEWIK